MYIEFVVVNFNYLAFIMYGSRQYKALICHKHDISDVVIYGLNDNDMV